MGIFSDYGRFVKARQFRDFCNAGAGVWFSLSFGSPRWDKEVPELGTDPERWRNLVPPSSPAVYTPVWKWCSVHSGAGTLSRPAESLLDPSFGSVDGVYSSPYAEDVYYEDHAYPYTDVPPEYIPVVVEWSAGMAHAFYPCDLETGVYTRSRHYPSASMPPFCIQYMADWSGYEPVSTAAQPSDPSQYMDYALSLHLSETGDSRVPVGLLSFVRGSAQFVEPIKDEEAESAGASENLKIFKYGAHYWRISDSADVSLPHHVLLSANVFPGDLSADAIADISLPVRQVCAFKFPDMLAEELAGIRRLRRAEVSLRYTDPGTHEEDSEVAGRVNLPYNAESPLSPVSIEPIIMDCMSARTRVSQQTDRYGYILGF